jgi:mannan endo-1,4-beta-mannosidase
MGGEAPRIVLYFSAWGEPFQAAYARTALNHRALTLVQINPADVSLAAIAAGRFDGYLRSYARQVRAFRDPVIIGFGHDMNARWYTWGLGHVRPSTWIAAWRHVVTVFRRQGAGNVTWMWTVNIIGPGIASPRPWWPGSAYVTWVGIDGYYYMTGSHFGSVLSPTVTDVRSFTRKPILIAETGISYQAAPAAMPGLIAGIRRRHLLGLVWFDANANQQWRLEGHPAAVAAFRSGVARMLAAGR